MQVKQLLLHLAFAAGTMELLAICITFFHKLSKVQVSLDCHAQINDPRISQHKRRWQLIQNIKGKFFRTDIQKETLECSEIFIPFYDAFKIFTCISTKQEYFQTSVQRVTENQWSKVYYPCYEPMDIQQIWCFIKMSATIARTANQNRASTTRSLNVQIQPK